MRVNGKQVWSLQRNRRGSVMLEFALIMPLFLSLVVGGVEFAFVMFSFSSIQQGTAFAAREISVNTAAAAQVSALVKSKLPDWLSPSVAVTVTQTNLVDPRQNTITVTSTAPAASGTPIPLFSNAYPWTLSTSVVVVQELPY